MRRPFSASAGILRKAAIEQAKIRAIGIGTISLIDQHHTASAGAARRSEILGVGFVQPPTRRKIGTHDVIGRRIDRCTNLGARLCRSSGHAHANPRGGADCRPGRWEADKRAANGAGAGADTRPAERSVVRRSATPRKQKPGNDDQAGKALVPPAGGRSRDHDQCRAQPRWRAKRRHCCQPGTARRWAAISGMPAACSATQSSRRPHRGNRP